ncbi:MAG TPA: desulfoferrodoxin family protein [Bacteroidales bacterium]|nr:desulfoferrodoxin family protein [Bacteroidales bacterium]
MKRFTVTLIALFCLFLTGVWANKTSVEIKAPVEVKAGDEVTIILNVSHNGNSKSHHTDWVYLKINGKEVQRWKYDKTSLPPDGNFSVEFKTVATGAMVIEAQGDCNIHGSKGVKSLNIKIIN